MQNAIRRIKRSRFGYWLRVLDTLLPHVAIILAGMLVVFFLIDRVNKPMAFMTNEFHKRITFILALLTLYLAVRRISALRRAERDAYKLRLRRYRDEGKPQ